MPARCAERSPARARRAPGPAVNTDLRNALLALQQRDMGVRAELLAAGTLHGGYHPRMQAVHRENAAALRRLLARHGWPGVQAAGADGAEAAWLVAQHAIAEPAFMRACRALLQAAVAAGMAPAWQHAYLDDRIRTFEGLPQRFGTQFDLTPGGAVLCAVEDPLGLDERRRHIGLEPVAERLRSLHDQPLPTPAEHARMQAAEQLWRREVGWLPSAAQGTTAVEGAAASQQQQDPAGQPFKVFTDLPCSKMAKRRST